MWWGITFLYSGIWGENLGTKQARAAFGEISLCTRTPASMAGWPLWSSIDLPRSEEPWTSSSSPRGQQVRTFSFSQWSNELFFQRLTACRMPLWFGYHHPSTFQMCYWNCLEHYVTLVPNCVLGYLPRPTLGSDPGTSLSLAPCQSTKVWFDGGLESEVRTYDLFGFPIQIRIYVFSHVGVGLEASGIDWIRIRTAGLQGSSNKGREDVERIIIIIRWWVEGLDEERRREK
jgi:hypothetical protein